MKKSAVLSTVIWIVWVFSGPVFAAEQTSESPATLFEISCSQCHLLKRALSLTKSHARWKKTVDRCRERLDEKASSSSDIFTVISREDAEKIAGHLFSERGYKAPERKTATAQERRKKLLRKFTPQKARTGAATDKRKKLLEKFTPSHASTGDVDRDRRKKLKEKFTTSKTSADRRKELLKKFKTSKAGTGSAVAERRKKLKEKFSSSKTVADRQRELKAKLKASPRKISAAEAKRNKFRQKFPPQKARKFSPGSKAEDRAQE